MDTQNLADNLEVLEHFRVCQQSGQTSRQFRSSAIPQFDFLSSHAFARQLSVNGSMQRLLDIKWNILKPFQVKSNKTETLKSSTGSKFIIIVRDGQSANITFHIFLHL